MGQQQWMWPDERSGGVRAAIIDFEDNKVMWFDQPGCACAGNDAEQTLADFIDKGPRKIMPPDDVLVEMQQAARQALS